MVKEHRYPLINYFIVIIGSLVLIWRLQNPLKDNLWSMNYAKAPSISFSKQCSDIPLSHQHAKIWLAQDALNQNNLKKAENCINLVEQETPLLLHTKGKLYEALNEYQSAINTWFAIGDMKALQIFGNKMVEIGNYSIALLAFEAAYQLNPEFMAIEYVDIINNTSHDYQKTESILQQVLEAYPDSSLFTRWLSRLGDSYRLQKKWVEAKNTYQIILDKNPAAVSALIGLGWTYYGANEFTLAIMTFQRILEINPDDSMGYYGVARVLSMQGKYQAAIDLYNLAISKDSSNYQIYYELSRAFQLNGQLDEAIISINTAIKLQDEPSYETILRLGSIYESAGSNDNAIEAYLKALSIDPNGKEAADGIERLNNE